MEMEPTVESEPRIRAVSATDSYEALTDLIHAAYASRAADKLRYWGTHQSVSDTAKRFQGGHGLVAEVDGSLVGTLTVNPPTADRDVPLYREPGVWNLCQFAVSPRLQNQGLGRRLHAAAISYARGNGGKVIALDTAIQALDLIEMYRRWGYRIVGEHDHRPFTNYLSVVMARSLGE